MQAISSVHNRGYSLKRTLTGFPEWSRTPSRKRRTMDVFDGSGESEEAEIDLRFVLALFLCVVALDSVQFIDKLVSFGDGTIVNLVFDADDERWPVLGQCARLVLLGGVKELDDNVDVAMPALSFGLGRVLVVLLHPELVIDSNVELVPITGGEPFEAVLVDFPEIIDD